MKKFAAILTAAVLAFSVTPAIAKSQNQTVCNAKNAQVRCLAIKHALLLPKGLSRFPYASAQLNSGAFGATGLRKAYGVKVLGSRQKVIAIVDAEHFQTAFDDLVGYRQMYGLSDIKRCGKPGESLTKLPDGSAPCFIQLNQDGKAVSISKRTTDTGWAQEIALDLAMASAACPYCSILLVEADSASFANLNAAVEVASSFEGVKAISNSYGGGDSQVGSLNAYQAAADKGIAVTASSGDSGYGVEAPASFPGVIAVGGTSLHVDASGNWLSESAWAQGGSGCSTIQQAPAWQDSETTKCKGKATADVAAVADPATGVTVYFDGGWYSFGGTSASSPFIAGLYAAKSNVANDPAGFTLRHADQLHDITTGSNGSCRTKIWCRAAVGWDAPTGLGTPNGTGAF